MTGGTPMTSENHVEKLENVGTAVDSSGRGVQKVPLPRWQVAEMNHDELSEGLRNRSLERAEKKKNIKWLRSAAAAIHFSIWNAAFCSGSESPLLLNSPGEALLRNPRLQQSAGDSWWWGNRENREDELMNYVFLCSRPTVETTRKQLFVWLFSLFTYLSVRLNFKADPSRSHPHRSNSLTPRWSRLSVCLGATPS